MRRLDDPADMTEAELLRAVRNARDLKRQAEAVVVAELRRRQWSWRRIGRELDLDHKTVAAWAQRPDVPASTDVDVVQELDEAPEPTSEPCVEDHPNETTAERGTAS